MPSYILIKHSIVIDRQDVPTFDNVNQKDSDTIAVDDDKVFTIGSKYDWYIAEKVKESNITYLRTKMALSKEQVDITLMAFGLYDKANKAINSMGSFALRAAWNNSRMLYTRIGNENAELIQLLEITETIMDEIFILGMAIDVSNPRGTLSGDKLFNFVKQDTYKKLQDSFNDSVKYFTDAQSHEMSSWAKQEEQARAWKTDNSISTPIIDSILATRNFGESKWDLVNKIIANSDAYQTTYGTLLGKYHHLAKTVDNATTVAELDSIVW